jgi:Periplasmic component of the Tol biopolymer transport system
MRLASYVLSFCLHAAIFLLIWFWPSSPPIKLDTPPVMGADLQKIVQQNLSFLPFMRLTDPRAVLGGVVLAGCEPPSLDFKRFQLAGSDIVVTTYWPEGDSGTRPVQIRAFETNSGGRLFGKEYPKVTAHDLPEVADRFCADLLEALTGNGSFFRSTLAFVKKTGKMSANVWLVKPTGRDLRQITNMPGESMSPAWSPDGRFVVFTHIDEKSHALGVWDRTSGKVQRIRFPGNVVIGPAFMPDNKVAVALSNGKYPVIFQLNHERAGILPHPQGSAVIQPVCFCHS